MRVICYPSDRAGCGANRIIWPAMALAAQGYDVKIAAKNPAVVSSGDRVVGIAQNIDADVVVFQRPCRRQYIEMFEILQKQGVRVVVDFDDDLTRIHPSNPAYGPYNYLNENQGMHQRYGTVASEMADGVVVTTPRLQEVYGGVVVPNGVPAIYLDIPRPENSLITVGYAGHIASHPDDLQVTHGGVNQALADTRGLSRFLALGDQRILANLGIREREPHGWQTGVPLPQYAGFVSQLDIGIVPLTMEPFNQAKSWLKALEYASLGVAPVVSPTYDNMRMVEVGAAIVALTPGDWIREIRNLIQEPEKLSALQKRARDFSSTQTIEGNAIKWWEAWTGVTGG